MDQAPLGIEKAREERINSNMERMKQFGIINLSHDINKRKPVDRYSVTGFPRSGSGKKGISIVQGFGTKLKDIPNVSFKLSKRRADKTLHSLHVLHFGRKSNAFHLKRNIIQFSGFVWTDDKNKTRLKKKIDKFSKDKLCEFCELLDIPISKAYTKKEEITGKLVEFLESPHVTSGETKRRKKSEKQAAEQEQEDVDEESDSEEEPAEDHITGKDNKEDRESKKGQEVEEEEDKEETKGKEKKKEKESKGKGHNLK